LNWKQTNGATTLRAIEELDHQIEIQQSQDNISKSILHKEPDEACRTLGFFDAPTCDPTAHYQVLKKRTVAAASALSTSSLSPYELTTLYKTIYRPQMTYAMNFTAFTSKQCNSIQNSMKVTILHAMGLHRNLPHAMVYAPESMGGLGLSDLHVEQGIGASTILLRMIRANGEVGTSLRIYLRWYQHIAGVGFPVLEQPARPITHVTEPWLDELRKFLANNDGGILLPNEPKPIVLRVNDGYIMDHAQTNFAGITLERINNARMYLQVERISELATADGQFLPAVLYKRPTREAITSRSTLLWRHVPPPDTKTWTAWRKWMKSLAPITTRRLYQPLGAWYTDALKVDNRDWKNVYDVTEDRVYRHHPQAHGFTWQTTHIEHKGRRWHLAPTEHPLGDDDEGYSLTSVPIDFLTNSIIQQPAPQLPRPLATPASLTRSDNSTATSQDEIHAHNQHKDTLRKIGFPTVSFSNGPEWMDDLLRYSSVASDFQNQSEAANIALQKALNTGQRTIYIGTDGSFSESYGGFGWSIGSPTMTIWYGWGVTRGSPITPFRSELYGRLAAFSFLQQFVRQTPDIGTFTVRSYCDSTSALKAEHKWADRNAHNSYQGLADALATLMNIQSNIPGMQLHSTHVKAHQDRKRSSRYKLPRSALLNIEADRLAAIGLHLAHHDQLPFLPLACNAYIKFDGRVLTSCYTGTIRYSTAHRQLSQFLAKYAISVATAQHIAWPSIALARKRKDLQTPFVTKLLCNWLASSSRLHTQGQLASHSCLRCQSPHEEGPEETFSHILRCPHPTAGQWRMEFLRSLDEHLEATATPPELWASIHHNARSFLHNTLTTNINSAQANIGWEHFFRGFIPTTWIQQVDAAAESQGHRHLTNRSDTWGADLVSFLWTQMRHCWVARCTCTDTHDRITADRVRINVLHERITALYEYRHITTYTRAFKHTLEQTLRRKEPQLIAWLQNHEDNILQGHQRFQIHPRQQLQRAITDFFPRLAQPLQT